MFTQEQKMIKIITKSLPAVISIEAYKDLKEIEKRNPQWIFPFSEKDISRVIALRDKIRGKHVHFGGGSGFIVDSSGIVVTNVHVIVRDHLNYEVTTSDGRKFPAVLATTDPIHDIAFLKIKSGTRFPTLALGDSSKTMLGQSVLAVGNALGLFRNTVSSGIISGLSRTIEANNESVSENLHGLIQTDAAINPGNSGGPLINMAGEVIGINAASVMQAENIGFAIPINTIKKDLEQVKKYGKIIQPFLGVKYITIDPKIKDVLKLPVNYGALATGSIKEDEAIIKNSPAYKAGLKEGDIILEIDGNKLTPSFTIQEFLDSAKIGQRISIKILRKEKEMVLSAILEERR